MIYNVVQHHWEIFDLMMYHRDNISEQSMIYEIVLGFWIMLYDNIGIYIYICMFPPLFPPLFANQALGIRPVIRL